MKLLCPYCNKSLDLTFERVDKPDDTSQEGELTALRAERETLKAANEHWRQRVESLRRDIESYRQQLTQAKAALAEDMYLEIARLFGTHIFGEDEPDFDLAVLLAKDILANRRKAAFGKEPK